MFERYTEKARNTVVRAKHEADRFGDQEIRVEHILLALLSDAVLKKDAMEGISENELREAIVAHLPRGEPIPLPHDLPLSSESRRVVALGAEEAESLGHQRIGNAHLLLGLMRCEDSHAAELLRQKGLSIENLRSQIAARALANKNQQESLPASQGNRPTVNQSPAEAEQGRQLVETVRRVGDLVSRGDGPSALQLLDDFMGEPGQGRELRVRLLGSFAAITAESIGDLKTARRYLEEMLGHDPENPFTLYSLADCLARQGETNEAKQYAAKSHELALAHGGTRGEALVELLEKRFPETRPQS